MSMSVIILAAGLGSRYSDGKELKQLAPVDNEGRLLIHYSIRGAVDAGFNQIIFVIRREMEEQFLERIGRKTLEQLEKEGVQVDIAYQTNANVYPLRSPSRTKPFGTVHALLSCEEFFNSPALVLNADDFYSRECFQTARKMMTDPDVLRNGGLVAYRLGNTLSPNGTVNRGVCLVGEDGYLEDVFEVHDIQGDTERSITFDYEDLPDDDVQISPDTPVSMNTWVLPPHILDAMQFAFAHFVDDMMFPDIEEYIISDFMSNYLLGFSGKFRKKIPVKVIDSPWLGITCKEDLEWVRKELPKYLDQIFI